MPALLNVGRVFLFPRLMEGEREKLLHLEDILHERVVGQECEAVTKVSEAILLSVEFKVQTDQSVPSYSLDPQVLENRACKTLPECLFDDEKNLSVLTCLSIWRNSAYLV